MIDWENVRGFNRDAGNVSKNWQKHGITSREAEEVMLNEPLVVGTDVIHSANEERFHALGQTDEGKRLHLTFTLRKNKTLLRIISARPMHRKERAIYDEKT